jgi:hypothetical protein
MRLRRSALAFALVLSWGFVSQDFTDELTRLIELVDNNELTEAIEGYRRLASQAASPPWLKASSQYEMAELHARLGDRKAATAALLRAFELGFDDCQSPLKSDHLAGVVKDSGVQARIRNVALAEPDYLEIVWLQSEVGHAEHDAKMMITENMNRVDQQETIVPQSSIPSRPTESAGVLYWRQQLRIMQAAQRRYVLESDRERMVHAATMQTMGGAGGSAAVVESARRARTRAEARRLDIQRRAFKVNATGGSLIKPCS